MRSSHFLPAHGVEKLQVKKYRLWSTPPFRGAKYAQATVDIRCPAGRPALTLSSYMFVLLAPDFRRGQVTVSKNRRTEAGHPIDRPLICDELT